MLLQAEDVSLLTSKPVQDFILKSISNKTDLLKVSEILSKTYTIEERKSIMDYMLLVSKIQKKFETKTLLLCDTLALEQSTAKDIGAWKQSLWPKEGHVNDLCCGMGGDSFFIPQSLSVTGVDLDPLRLEMYRYNTKQFGKDYDTALADVCTFKNDADYFTIDPARRENVEENQRCFTHLSPSIAEVIELASKYKGGMAKIPPGYPLEELPNDVEVLYLGKSNDCRECLVLFGSLCKNPGKIRAVMIEKDHSFTEWISEKERASLYQDLPIAPLSDYIIEPAPLLVRSHLFVQIAERNNLFPFSQGIAYLSGSTPLEEKGFANFKVLETCPLTTSTVRQMLKKYSIGQLTLKKRGVEVIPENEIKRLAPKGKNEGTLFYTRLAGEKVAILTKRLY